MKRKTNMSDVPFPLVPEGTHLMKIIEIVETDKYGMPLTTEAGDPMARLKLVPVELAIEAWVWDQIVISDNPQSSGYKIKGRSKHFLHCIGMPYEGEFEWDANDWIGKKVKAEIKHEAPNKFHNYVKAIVGNYILDEEAIVATNGKTDDDGIPF